MFDPVVHHARAHIELVRHFGDGKFTGAFQFRERHAVLITNPGNHRLGKRLPLRTVVAVPVERGGDLGIGLFRRQSTDSLYHLSRVTKAICHWLQPIHTQVFASPSLPANVEQELARLVEPFHGDVLDQQSQEPFFVPGGRGGRIPQTGQVLGQSEDFRSLLFCDGNAATVLKICKVPLDFLQASECFVPTLFEGRGNQPITRIHLFVAALGKLGLIVGALDTHSPLPIQAFITLLQFVEYIQGDVDMIGVDGADGTLRHRLIHQAALNSHTRLGRPTLPPAPAAFVNRINAAVALVTNRQSTTANATQQQPLKKGKTFACRTAQQGILSIRAIAFKTVQIVEMLVKRNVSFVVILDLDQPRCSWHAFHPRTNLAVGEDILDTSIAPKNIDARIRWVLQHAQNAIVRQMAPNELTVPCATVGPLWKCKSPFGKPLRYGIGAACFSERNKQQFYRPAHLGVRVQHNRASVIVVQPDRQGKSQFTLLGFVQFAALEAGTKEMQFCLGHLGLQTKQQPVVEIARIVAAVFVDDQRAGQRAYLDQPIPIGVGAAQSGAFQSKDRSHFAQRYIGHQLLEVVATIRRRRGNRLVPVENSRPDRRPSKRNSFVFQSILPFGALLMMPHLLHRRLTHVNVRHFLPVNLSNLRRHDTPPAFQREKVCRPDRPRSCWPRVWPTPGRRSVQHRAPWWYGTRRLLVVACELADPQASQPRATSCFTDRSARSSVMAQDDFMCQDHFCVVSDERPIPPIGQDSGRPKSMMQCPERPLVRDQPGWSIPEERQTCRGKFPVEPAFRFLELAGFSTVRSVFPSKGETGAKSQPIPKGRCDQVQLPSTVPCLRDKIVQEAIRMASGANLRGRIP